MELILERIAKKKTYTIGRLSIVAQAPPTAPEGASIDKQTNVSPSGDERGAFGAYFCDTLEPTWRDYEHGAYKVKGRSAIPEGRYAVVISFSPKMQKWLPILLGVRSTGRAGLKIYSGLTHLYQQRTARLHCP